MKTKKVFLSVMFGVLFFSTNGIGQTKKPVAKKTTTIGSTKATIEKEYQFIDIGDAKWMTKNLDVSHFRNGDLIPEAKTADEWINALNKKKPAWCYYKLSESDKIKYGNPQSGKYGKMYNYYAVTDSRVLVPKGWKIATFENWANLLNAVNGDIDYLKGSSSWTYNKVNAQKANKTGFNLLAAGMRYDSRVMGDFGGFNGIGLTTSFWYYDEQNRKYKYISFDNSDNDVSFNRYSDGNKSIWEDNKDWGDWWKWGIYIRCVKEDNSLDIKNYYNNGVDKFNAKDNEGAIKEINSYIKLAPEDYNGFYMRGAIKGRLNDWKGAVEDYEEGWNLVKLNYKQDEENAKNLVLCLGLAYIQIGDKNNACFYFNEAQSNGDEKGKGFKEKYCN
jgi:uncharacterized protein (TIGR02145 family)